MRTTMTDKPRDPNHQLTDDLSERLRSFHADLLKEFGLKGLRFRVGYGGTSGIERRQNTVNGVLQVKIKARHLDLEFEKEEDQK